MKLFCLWCIAIASIMLLCPSASAQLSGDYYIGNRLGSAPGGADPDFDSLKTWRNRLSDTTAGLIVGPCTFYLLDSVYQITGATLSRITMKGSSETNTVTLKPYPGVKPTIEFLLESASSTGQIQFGDESFSRTRQPQYFTIDGSNTVGGTSRDLTFNFFGQNGLRVFVDCKHITIKNCVITNRNVTATSSNSHCIVFSMQYRTAAPAGTFSPDSGLVENCVLIHNGGSGLGRGIGLNAGTAPPDPNLGITGLVLRNNIISANERGIYATWVKDAEIYGNTIRVHQEGTREATGIYLERTAGTSAGEVNVYRNTIDTVTTTNATSVNGIQGVYAGPLVSGTVNLYNNFISGFGTPATSLGFLRGISVDSLTATVNVVHNSIHVPATALADSVYGIFVRNIAGAPAVTIRNNIVALYEDDDTSYCVATLGSTGTFVSNFNAFHAGGAAKVGLWQGTEHATLANWKAASNVDANSTTPNPGAAFGGAGQWTSPTNLHFVSKPSNEFASMPASGITMDIDGETRGSYPYMGADEIAGSPLVLGVGDDPEAAPLKFALAGNYPNPFNPTTSIQYSIARSSHVTLDVCNVLGQRIATLVNQTMDPGTYTARWDGRSNAGTVAPSGVYYYTLVAGSFKETRAMVLMK